MGDGTKVPQETAAVKIADDVAEAAPYWYLKTNGEFWTWSEDNPVPTKLLDNVATVYDSNRVILDNGKCIYNVRNWLEGDQWVNNGAINNPIFQIGVKIPETLIFG